MDFGKFLLEVVSTTSDSVEPLTAESAEFLLARGGVNVAYSIAENASISPKVLAALKRDEDALLRTALVRNPSLPAEIVVELLDGEQRSEVLKAALKRLATDPAATVEMVREVAAKVTHAGVVIDIATIAHSDEIAADLTVRAFSLAGTDPASLDRVRHEMGSLRRALRKWLTNRFSETAEGVEVSPAEARLAFEIMDRLTITDQAFGVETREEALDSLRPFTRAALRLADAGLLDANQRQTLSDTFARVRHTLDTTPGSRDFITAEAILAIFAEGPIPTDPEAAVMHKHASINLKMIRTARDSRDPQALAEIVDSLTGWRFRSERITGRPIGKQVAEELLTNPAFPLNSVNNHDWEQALRTLPILGEIIQRRFPEPVTTVQQVREILTIVRIRPLQKFQRDMDLAGRRDLGFIFETARGIDSDAVMDLFSAFFPADAVPVEALQHGTLREIEELRSGATMRRMFNLLTAELGTDAAMWDTLEALMINFEGTLAELIVAVKELS